MGTVPHLENMTLPEVKPEKLPLGLFEIVGGVVVEAFRYPVSFAQTVVIAFLPQCGFSRSRRQWGRPRIESLDSLYCEEVSVSIFVVVRGARAER
jgi:hypothetical protein